MVRRPVALVLWLTASPLLCGAGEFHFPGQVLTVPDGFVVERVAGPPLVNRPITADFDEKGRLYVTDSSGSNDDVREQLVKKPHRVVRLEDTDGDGLFDRSTVFAERMMFPEGTLWYDGSLYVAAPPSIWRLTDTDDDGVADWRVEWFQGKTLTGCANDLHGPYLGPDGWIYWCKGAYAEQRYERPGREPLVTRAAHIFRCRPDGSGIEAVMTGGMANPVDVVFTPEGERVFTSTFIERPGGGKRDGLAHAVYGGLYGQPRDVLDDHPRTGELMPVLAQLGPSAPCGLARYSSRVFGAGFENNLFAALFNRQRITRHVLEISGATFRSHDSDFLVSDSPDFHPTDVFEDADGSLIVIDTGGWYKLCCPTSQLWKPDILGAIYRVRRLDAPALRDPRGLDIDWAALGAASLARRLADGRPAVRRRAIQRLGRLGEAACDALAGVLEGEAPADARRNAVWSLTRVDGKRARSLVRRALADGDAGVRQVAAHAAGIWRDPEALPALARLVGDAAEPPPVQRAAAEALGRIGDGAAVPTLLRALSRRHDRALEHSLTHALIEIAAPAATAAGLGARSLLTRRAALVALDQMRGDALQAETAIPWLAAAEPLLGDTASWIVGGHPEWGADLVSFLRRRRGSGAAGGVEIEGLDRLLGKLASSPDVQAYLAGTLEDGASRGERQLALRAMRRAGLEKPPASWAAALARVLTEGDAGLAAEAISTARSVRFAAEGTAGLSAALLHRARDPSLSVDLRLEALAGVPGGLKEVDDELFDFLRSRVEPARPVRDRGIAADTLVAATLSRGQLIALTETVKAAGPLDVPRLLPAFEKRTDESLGQMLLDALESSDGLPGVRVDALGAFLEKLPGSLRARGERLLAVLDVDLDVKRARLQKLLATLPAGDIRRGQAIFNGPRAACSSCHEIGYLGGKSGPDLTRIGTIRTQRDLLESVVFPSASFVRGYEPMLAITRTGEAHNGYVRHDGPRELVLVTGPDEEARIPRREILELRPGTVSIMPAGLDTQLTLQELADLLAFLKNTRWK